MVVMQNGKPDIAINAGIAGSYKNDIKIGDVVYACFRLFCRCWD